MEKDMYGQNTQNALCWILYKRCWVYLLMVSMLLPSCSTSKVYKHPQWRSFKETQKTLGILPFQYAYTFDQKPKRVSQEELKALEQKAAESLRQDVYRHLLAHRAGNRKQFQATSTTDSILIISEMNTETINQYTEKELATLLAVDGVFKVEVATHFFRSEAEALAIMILSIFSVSTKKITATATLHDGNSGELVWKYERSLKGGLLDSERKIRKKLKKKITKRLPYKGKANQ